MSDKEKVLFVAIFLLCAVLFALLVEEQTQIRIDAAIEAACGVEK